MTNSERVPAKSGLLVRRRYSIAEIAETI